MINLLVLDVDGTLTNGQIIYSYNDEFKSFNVKDGLAIVSWIKIGKKVAIITGRNSKLLEKRAKELGVHYLYQNEKDKLSKLKEIKSKENLKYKNIAFVGDDLNDYKLFKKLKETFAPKDSSKFIKKIANFVLKKNGGEGAVREAIEIILRKENLINKFLKVSI